MYIYINYTQAQILKAWLRTIPPKRANKTGKQ